MPRTDIWRDGINTRFSRENQPTNRGRKKTSDFIYQSLLNLLNRVGQQVEQRQRDEQEREQQRRDQRNARRRERYRLKNNVKTT